MEENIYKDGGYLENNPSWHLEDSKWKADNIIKILDRNNIKPKSVAEIGCGAGGILECLTSELSFADLIEGYDISKDALELAKSRQTEKLKFYDLDFINECKKTFDLVMAIDVFEHIEDNFSFLRNLRTKAEYKVFHIPLDLSVQTVWRSKPILEGRESVGHIHYYTKELALALLKDTGYEVLDYFYTAGSLDLPNRGWKANLLKLPRKILYNINKDFAVRILGGFSLMVLAK